MQRDNAANRVRAACSTSSTDWLMVATDGVGYASYALLVAAGKTPFPGPPSQFPTGCPEVIVRSVGSDQTSDGSAFDVMTNNIATPAIGDDLVSGQGQQMVYRLEGVKCVWVKKSVAGDIIRLLGLY